MEAVTIVIPVAYDAVGLETTLTSLQDMVRPVPIEIIVVNDGADPAISALCEEFESEEIRINSNQGSYTARNAGIQRSKNPILVFLDADQVVDPNWLAAGLEALKGFDYLAGNVKVSVEPDASLWEKFDQLTAFPVVHMLDESRFAPTANLFVRRRVFDELGLFDDRLRSGGDKEFGNRVALSGRFRMGFCEQAITHHPARDWHKNRKKLNRVLGGQIALAKYYPDRYPSFRPGLSALVWLWAPPVRSFRTRVLRHKPHWSTKDLVVFFLMYWVYRFHSRRLRIRHWLFSRSKKS